jgi:hypothetical protein
MFERIYEQAVAGTRNSASKRRKRELVILFIKGKHPSKILR